MLDTGVDGTRSVGAPETIPWGLLICNLCSDVLQWFPIRQVWQDFSPSYRLLGSTGFLLQMERTLS